MEIAISILAARVTEKQMAIHNVIDETRRISPKTLNYTFTV
ncbi:MAG TPA: hypothetical protein VHZ04_02830 [Candidatus Paceibacterota bacterium]|nr:hypothetical protein [Candidatus Paceibacterota bacterium]